MFDFDKVVNRRHSNCVKWDEMKSDDVIPMWVADMDFQTAPCIINALQKRVTHGVFGYTLVGDEYYDAVVSWWKRRHQWNIRHEWIQYVPGVVPAISVIIKALTQPGDKVIVMTPVYNCFYSSIRNNGCEISTCPLRRIDNNDGSFTYEIDFEDLDSKTADKDAKLLLLCNPHNPAGRVWSREELRNINKVCMKNGVRVVSDEIHCELVMPGNEFTPFASVSKECQDNSITCNSPSKSFNTAGLQIANIICNDADLRQKIDRAININEVCDVNPFGVAGLIAAYNEGEQWLDELNAYLYSNYLTLVDMVRKDIPSDQVKVCQLEGTYLVWIDVSGLLSHLGVKDSEELCHKLEKEAKVYFNPGTMYDHDNGSSFIRINIACPRSQMVEGMKRFTQYVRK